MLCRIVCLALAGFFPYSISAQVLTPEVVSWMLNLTGQTGYNGIPSNVQQVQYGNQNVYVACTCIPGFDIGPWAGNPNTPVNQNFTFKITRAPVANTGTLTSTPNGHIGVFINGVSIFNATDARSYQNQNIWHQDAYVSEATSFDDCLGHPAPNGEYHHHITPNCLYDPLDSLRHSPLIGYAFDGFPIYGGYGYADPATPGAVRRVRPGYRLRAITQRRTRPDGTPLQPAQYGPDVSLQNPLGKYVEDYEYAAGAGDLDAHNGRFGKTPEYPNGTYAYFTTIDRQGGPIYPYTIGPAYFGIVQAGNTGPQSGHNTPTEPVTVYNPATASSQGEEIDVSVGPNPAKSYLTANAPGYSGPLAIRITDAMGRLSLETRGKGPDVKIPVSNLVPGIYIVQVELKDGQRHAARIVRD